MIQKRYIIVCIFLLIIIGIIVFRSQTKVTQTITQVPSQVQTIAQASPTPSETPPSTTSATVNVTTKSTSAPAPGGPTRGQVTCDYQIPATPNQFGTASIESNWNNLVPGKNGTTKLALCVSVNGNNSLMSIDTRANGTLTTSAPWISLNTDYAFNLYDDYGGDSSECGGTILSSCHVSQNFATVGPSSAPGRH